jgi:transcription-repair coupling factor (superfamily II helicase)
LVLTGLHQADAAFLFSELWTKTRGCYLWLCLNNRQADIVADDLSFFLPRTEQRRVMVFPGSETDPYRGLSPHPDIAERRAAGLWRLLQGHQGFVVTTLASLAVRLSSPDSFLSRCLRLEVGDQFPLAQLLSQLRALGYVREEPVTEVGEFSWRGGIVDVYAPSWENPVRIEFFGDEIESIRAFHPGTQRSTALAPQVDIAPMRETVLTEADIARWTEEAPRFWGEVRFAEALQEKLQFTESRETFNGWEYVFPLVVPNPASLFDYLPGDATGNLRVVLPDPERFESAWKEADSALQVRFEEFYRSGELVLPPSRLFFDRPWLNRRLAEHQVFRLDCLDTSPGPARRLDFRLERKYQGRIPELLNDLTQWRTRRERTVFVMSSRGVAERLTDSLREYDVPVHFAEDGWHDTFDHSVSVTHGRVSEGFHTADFGFHLLTQDQIFETSQLKVSARKPPLGEVPSSFLSDFRDLRAGDCVVHVDHGIGLFRGLKRIGVGEDMREFVELAYQDEAKLYVPVERLDLLQKYSGASDAAPPLDRLGGTSWEKTKTRVKKSMQALAADLLKLYAQREVTSGFAFSPDDALLREFDDAFVFEETPDQHQAIVDVKRDMETARPMDRLICGDVGYGKTEVAMRAAFKAVNDNKQAAVLAPTTVLAFQHLNTFRQRFQGFPVTVEMASRFRSRAELKEVLERTELGMVDILIGTHRLLSKDVRFHDLGLLVIDEEQRFGVAQKERLKQLKTKVDVLTLSATPIPRTLNMSMIGLRDLSIIETPPKDRLSIQTVVVRFSHAIIRSAIDLELNREGQVLFLHNSIETIYTMGQMVQEIMPKARVAVAHGRMSERQLEEVMMDFLNYKYDVLVSTTIIENGLDIARANTLIVNQAHRFGLSQLYQLRGRVGRSNRRAYAYLLIPPEEVLGTDARKRLAAIKEFSDLGAGFRIAALDMEIRGAGNLLGGEQHGHIAAVGFELYVKLLEQTIRELKGEPAAEEFSTGIDLRLDIQVPEHYIPDANQRLWLYKRISSVASPAALNSLKEETTDRFGKYPRSVANLFEYAALKMTAQKLRIVSLDRKDARIQIKFKEDTPVTPQHLIRLLRHDRRLSLSPDGTLSLQTSGSTASEMFPAIHRVLEELAAG